MVLQGAEILLYPTAIGSEPQDEGLDSRDHWKRVMQGHAGANLVYLIWSQFAFNVLYFLTYSLLPFLFLGGHKYLFTLLSIFLVISIL